MFGYVKPERGLLSRACVDSTGLSIVLFGATPRVGTGLKRSDNLMLMEDLFLYCCRWKITVPFLETSSRQN